MVTKPLRTRRRFHSQWDEIAYLRQKLLYWLYEREDRRQSSRYSRRLEELLEDVSPDHQAILGEECWSLVSEAQGDLALAIRYRENEIRLIKKLQRVAAESPHRDFLLQGYQVDDLSDRLDLLAVLYHDSGDLDRAIQTLRQSELLCKANRIPFDGDDILEEYLAESNLAHAV